jgi:uncharacterized protein YjdB
MPLPKKASLSLLALGLTVFLPSCDAGITAPLQEERTPAELVIARISISPKEDTISAGESIHLAATVVDPDGSPVPDVNVSWASLDDAIAEVGTDGVVVSRTEGIARITAASGDKRDTVRVHVQQKKGGGGGGGGQVSVTVSPEALTLDALGDTARLAADVQQAKGNAAVTWTSLDPAVATVDGSGLITAKGTGTVLVTATSSGKADTARIEVRQVVASLAVTPAAPVLEVDQTQQMSAVAKDANGNEVRGAAFTWMSSNQPVATVSGSGLVSAVASGTSYVTASSGEKSATATLTVNAPAAPVPPAPPAPVAAVKVSPGTSTIETGQTLLLDVATVDASGSTLDGRTVSWTSSNTAVARVSSSGMVTGVAAGTVTITATSEGKAGTAQVTVKAPVALPAVLFQDGFDTGVRATTLNGAGWKRTGSGSLVSGRGRGGGHALEFYWPATPAGVSGNNPPLQEERFQVPQVREAWFEWWVLLPKNWNHRREDPLGTTDNNKFFALWADQYATNGHAQLVLEFNADAEHYGQTSAVKSVFRNEQGIVENDRAFRKAPIIVPEQIGVWTRYRVHVRLSSGPGKKDGTARLWRDNTLVWDTGNFEWWQEGGTNHFANGYLFGAQNSGYDQETTVYLDDFKIHHSNPGW